MSFLRRFISIFVAPTQVFDDIKESRVGWWQPWLMVAVLMIIGTWLMLPMQRVLMEMNPKFSSGADVEKQMKAMQGFQLVIAPGMGLIICFFVAGISYVMVTLQSKEATFKKYFTLVLFANVIFSLGYVVSTVLLRARGTENISSPEDMHASLSLRLLAPSEAGALIKGILGSVEFFAIWGLSVIAAGLRRMFGLRLGQAIGCVVPLWVLYAIMSVVGEKFGMG